MQKFIVILEVIILSGTNAQAATLKIKDININDFKSHSTISYDAIQLSSSIKEGRAHTVNSKRNIYQTVADNEPPNPRRGSPDDRGTGGTK